jgi:hypothetical protein
LVRGYEINMDEWEREELLIRMDERIKTIYNRMDKFETLFTNHLHHHEMWENDIKGTYGKKVGRPKKKKTKKKK